jgi:dihydroorotase
VIDPQQQFVYTADQVVSKSRNTPFLGWSLQGRAMLTMVGGSVRANLLF